MKYATPLCLCLFSFYTVPWLIYKVVQFEHHERKSEKEESYMNKNVFMMGVNCLFMPLFCFAFISSHANSSNDNSAFPSLPKLPNNVMNSSESDYYDMFLSLYATKEVDKSALVIMYADGFDSKINEIIVNMISQSEEFFIRFFLQIFILLIVY